MVEQFEADFGAFCGTPYCIGVASGTDALRFALLAALSVYALCIAA
jgi:dTDP-4-amino-4,6-dideoxygalactose transaminase